VPCTLQELGEDHSLSRERIRQLQTRALENVRAALRFTGMRDDLARTA